MAGDVANVKVCSPLKLRSGLTGKCHAICHYSYNFPLYTMLLDDITLNAKQYESKENFDLGF